MSPVRIFASIPIRISPEIARFNARHADHDSGEIVVGDNDSDLRSHDQRLPRQLESPGVDSVTGKDLQSLSVIEVKHWI